MANVYIHCGLPKTGTTSIQKYVSQHRGELRHAGYDYPEICVNQAGTAHHNLAREMLGESDFAPKSGTIADMLQYLLSCRNQPNIVLSSEGLTHCLLREKNKLFDFIRRTVESSNSIHIVFTFREFHRIAESSYLDHLRKGARHDCRHPVRLGRTTKWLSSLAGGLSDLEMLVGERRFAVCDVAEQDSVTAFAKLLGLNLPCSIEREHKFNRRLGLKKAALIHRLLFPIDDSATSNFSKDQLMQARRYIRGMPDLPGETFEYRLIPRDDANEIQGLARELLPSFIVSRLPKALEPELGPYETIDLGTVEFSIDELAAVKSALPKRLSVHLPWLDRAAMV